MKYQCPLCDYPAASLYPHLRDELFGSPGVWHLYRCSNTNCGLGSLQPPPTSAEIMAAYESYHTHAPAEPVDSQPSASLTRTLWGGARERFQARRFGYAPKPLPAITNATANLLSWLIPLSPGHRADFETAVFHLDAPVATAAANSSTPCLLEVGCGNGKLLKRMQDFGWQVTGTDFDDNAVAAARSRNLDVRSGPLAAQQFAQGSFDAIVLKHVIEHVTEPIAELTLCASLLKPGGKLVLLTPNFAGRGHARWQQHWRGLEPPRHLHLFTPAALQAAIKQSGLQIQTLTTTGRTRSAYRQSLDAERLTQGKGNMPTLASLALAELDEWLEAVVRLRDPLRGNELLAIATRA